MPQMAPLNWLSLMMTFIMIMMTFNLMNYFMFNYPAKKIDKKTTPKKTINWKW